MFVRPFLVGDAALAFSTTMMKGYNGNPAQGTLEHAYNYAHIHTRRVVENASSILKGRFYILKGTNLDNVDSLIQVNLLCCAFHNICICNNDPWGDNWLPTQDGADAVPEEHLQDVPLHGPEGQQATLIKRALAERVITKDGF